MLRFNYSKPTRRVFIVKVLRFINVLTCFDPVISGTWNSDKTLCNYAGEKVVNCTVKTPQLAKVINSDTINFLSDSTKWSSVMEYFSE